MQKTTYKLLVIVLTAFLLGALIGNLAGSNPSVNPITITPRSFTETANYVIFIEDSTYNAKNGTTGEIEFSGTNASEIVNNVIGNDRKIVLLDGVFDLSGSNSCIWIDHISNLEIYGSGNTVIYDTWSPSSSRGIIHIRYSHNITIRDITIKGSTSQHGTHSIYIISECSDITIDNIKIYGSCMGIVINGYNYPLGAQGTPITNVLIQNCYFEGIGYTSSSAIYTQNVKNIKILANTFNTTRKGTHFLYIAQLSYDMDIVHNYFFNVNQGGGDYAGGGACLSARTNTTGIFSDNIVINGGQISWGSDSTWICSDNYLLTTAPYYSNQTSIIAALGAENDIISNNKIINPLDRAITIDEKYLAIPARNVTGTIISGNTIINASSYGIYLISASNVVVSSNILFDCSAGIVVAQRGGYDVPTHNLLSGNIAHNCSIGIYLMVNSDTNYILSCLAYDCSSIALLDSGTNNVWHHCLNETSWIS